MEPLTDRSRWLADRLVGITVTNGVPDLSRSGGVTGDRPDLLGDLAAVVGLMAEVLKRIHQLPIDDCPFDRGWAAIRERVEMADGIDTDRLPEPYRRYDLETLRGLWRDSRPETDELVVCHGDPVMANMAFGENGLVGLGGTDRLCVADRHLDLAIAHQSIQQNLGPEAVFVFYEAYEIEPDLLRLDHYVLASHLL